MYKLSEKDEKMSGRKSLFASAVVLLLTLSFLAVSTLLVGADGDSENIGDEVKSFMNNSNSEVNLDQINLIGSWKEVKVTTTKGGTVYCVVTKIDYYHTYWIGEDDSDIFWAPAGSKLTCEPYPKSGYEFDGWTGTPGDLQGNKYVKNVNNGIDITAHFTKKKVKITFTYTGSGVAPEVSYQVEGGPQETDTAPLTIQVDRGRKVSFSYETIIEDGGSRYILESVSHSSPVTANGDITITAKYKTEYYLKVSSAYDTPTPSSGWFEKGTEITAKVSSPVLNGGSRYTCTGWVGTGSVPSSGSSSSFTFTINEPSSITWKWRAQYLVTFRQMGLESDSYGDVVTVDSVTKGLVGLPYSIWVNEGDSIEYHYETSVSGGSGNRYWLQRVTGPSSPIKVKGPETVTGVYVKFSPDDSMNVIGEGFRLIYTENTWNPLTYKLTTTKSSSFQYNVFYLGSPGENIDIEVSIPYPFVTVGETPVRVYGYVDVLGKGIFEPSQELKNFRVTGTETHTSSGSLGIALSDYEANPRTANSMIRINANGIVPETGLVFLTVQLSYGLKGSSGYTSDAGNNAMIGFSEKIRNQEDYTFSYVAGEDSGNTTMRNENVFKRNNGFAGIVTDENGEVVEGALVYLYGPSGNLIGSTLTDSDGWYGFSYRHSGGVVTYTLKCNGVTKSIIVYSEQRVVVNF
ncbi:MAG: carboxypeptidase-like regulatory domain-containing protein [Candidatus Korarchaeum sp.]